MYRCAAFVKVSPDYWKALSENPGSDREGAVRQLMESVGGKLLSFGYTHGQWDALVVGEAPSEIAFLSCLAKAWFAGMLTDINTIPMMDQATVTGAMAMVEQANYAPPGQ